MSRVVRIFLCVIVLFLFPQILLGCSRSYQPISDWEQQEFDKADRTVYPDDVRQNLSEYNDTIIAWAALIKNAQVYQTDEGPEIKYILEHHYYDWIEDSGIQPEHIFLSPRGEGEFTTIWELRSDISPEALEELADVTEMLIVYGIPVGLEDEVIIIEASYIRGIKKRYYTTEKFDYGRDGSDFKILSSE